MLSFTVPDQEAAAGCRAIAAPAAAGLLERRGSTGQGRLTLSAV